MPLQPIPPGASSETISKTRSQNAEIDKFYSGILKDVYSAILSLSLVYAIGKNADSISESGFGHLFGVLQDKLLNDARLCICRIFEKESKKHHLHSIPAALEFLKKNICDDDGISKDLVARFSEKIDDVNGSLRKIKTGRDKLLAHREAIEVKDLPIHTYAEMDCLIALAKDFLSAIGPVCLVTHPNFEINLSDASDDLERLLKEAGIIPGDRRE